LVDCWSHITVMNSTGHLRCLIIFINSCWSRNGIHNLCIFHKVDPKFSMKSLGIGLNYATVICSYIVNPSIIPQNHPQQTIQHATRRIRPLRQRHRARREYNSRNSRRNVLDYHFPYQILPNPAFHTTNRPLCFSAFLQPPLTSALHS